jgi:hypothetical protein
MKKKWYNYGNDIGTVKQQIFLVVMGFANLTVSFVMKYPFDVFFALFAVMFWVAPIVSVFATIWEWLGNE